VESRDERGKKELEALRDSLRNLRGRRVLEMRQRNVVQADERVGGYEIVESKHSEWSDEDRWKAEKREERELRDTKECSNDLDEAG